MFQDTKISPGPDLGLFEFRMALLRPKLGSVTGFEMNGSRGPDKFLAQNGHLDHVLGILGWKRSDADAVAGTVNTLSHWR